MILIPFAVAIGVLIAYTRGGSFGALDSIRVRSIPILVIGALLVIVADLTSIPGAVGLLVIGLLFLLVGLGRNLHLPGVITIALGVALNTLVIVVNGHIPVRLEALIGAGEAPEGTTPSDVVAGSIDLGSVRELEDSGTRLSFLGDIVPVGLLDTVVSFGDLIASAGVIVLTSHIMTRKAGAVDLDELFDAPEIDLREPQVRRTQPGRPAQPGGNDMDAPPPSKSTGPAETRSQSGT